VEVALIWFVLSLLVFGLVAGAIARLLVPGRDRLGCGGTILLGIVGSFIGGLIGFVLFDRDASEGALQPSGLFGSVVGAMIALLVLRSVRGRR
jgi:uncharacterized membrane protein YeaQ/YmgE (transglycosylase-associated protein family)